MSCGVWWCWNGSYSLVEPWFQRTGVDEDWGRWQNCKVVGLVNPNLHPGRLFYIKINENNQFSALYYFHQCIPLFIFFSFLLLSNWSCGAPFFRLYLLVLLSFFLFNFLLLYSFFALFFCAFRRLCFPFSQLLLLSLFVHINKNQAIKIQVSLAIDGWLYQWIFCKVKERQQKNERESRDYQLTTLILGSGSVSTETKKWPSYSTTWSMRCYHSTVRALQFWATEVLGRPTCF